MRPIVSEQDPLRYPLNDLLGTRANIRLLRVMANDVDGPLSASDVAKRAGLTMPGAQKALASLFKSGFITKVGGGRKHQYEIRRADRLIQITLELFQAEKARYASLVDCLKKAVERLTPPPYASWIQSLPKTHGDPLTVGLLHESRQLANALLQLRAELSPVEKDVDLTIELRGYTKADLPQLEADGITALYGVLPSLEEPFQYAAGKPMTHLEKDRQMKRITRHLAKAIESDSSLIRRAREHVDRLIEENQGASHQDLIEWRDILDMHSTQRLSQFLTSSSERAERLRQSNPLFAILTPEERANLFGSLGHSNDA